MKSILVFVLLFSWLLSGCSEDDSRWRVVSPGTLGMDAKKLEQARDYALAGGGSGYIIRGGQVVMKWGSETKRYDLKSTTKSIGLSALGLALMDGRVNLNDRVADRLGELMNAATQGERSDPLKEVTIRQLAEQTAGFDKKGDYCDHLFEPGSAWAYSDCGPNWLADYLTLEYGVDLWELLDERVFGPIGISKKDLRWRQHAYREPDLQGIPRREFGSGISANIRAMALIGELYLRHGMWKEDRILPVSFVDSVGIPSIENTTIAVTNDPGLRYADAPRHYGLLWWNNGDGTLANVPRDAYWSWGLHDSFIFVIPSLDIVAVRAGQEWPGDRSAGSYSILSRFLDPVIESVNYGAPYANSEVITGIKWSTEVTRFAEGSDNWPLTWGTDDNLYTAYGDGWGFSPRLSEKVSLGIARVSGMPSEMVGSNVRSRTGEQLGDGASGKKASGMLMVDDTLFMWVRNANANGKHCQLAWSIDLGVTWEWSSWTHKRLGYCAFLNYGKNYDGAPDEYVYTYSPDTESAYVPGDRVILARVHKSLLRQVDAYEYFAGLDENGESVWSESLGDRQSIYDFPNGCNRLDVVYNSGLRKYILTMRSRAASSGRHAGIDQWSMYESNAPWGPWRTVFYTDDWDVDPGEVLHIPSKWISADGIHFTLVFAGSDSFAVRSAEFSVR